MAGKIVIGVCIPCVAIAACCFFIMYMRKRDAPNKTQDEVTKKEVEEDPDTEQIPHPITRLKTEPHYQHQKSDEVAQELEARNRIDTERYLIEVDDFKNRIRNGEEQAGLDFFKTQAETLDVRVNAGIFQGEQDIHNTEGTHIQE